MREIARIVEELDYQPILALDFDVPEDKIRDYDLLLLHNCKYAIFEITFGDGHLVEIERASNYKLLSILLVFQVRDESRRAPPSASQMLLTSTFPRFEYRTFEELREYLSTFLPRRIVVEKELGVSTAVTRAVTISTSETG